MKISIYTQILPRLEVFYLEEWIEHHLSLGVDEIYIYDNGFVSKDTSKWATLSEERQGTLTEDELAVKNSEYCWSRKPFNDYFLDYSDDEIMNHLHDIVNSYEEVTLKSWRLNIEHQHQHPAGQIYGYMDCVDNNKSDWWFHIDPDEYLILKKHETLKEFVYDNMGMFRFQFMWKMFKGRERGRSVRGIFDCIDIPPENGKTLVKNIKFWSSELNHHDDRDIHKPTTHSRRRRFMEVPSELGVLHHYQGNQDGIIDSFDKTDCGMKKYLE